MSLLPFVILDFKLLCIPDADCDGYKEMFVSVVKPYLPSQNTDIRSNSQNTDIRSNSQSQSQTNQQPSESNPNDKFFVFQDAESITSGVNNAIEV